MPLRSGWEPSWLRAAGVHGRKSGSSGSQRPPAFASLHPAGPPATARSGSRPAPARAAIVRSLWQCGRRRARLPRVGCAAAHQARRWRWYAGAGEPWHFPLLLPCLCPPLGATGVCGWQARQRVQQGCAAQTRGIAQVDLASVLLSTAPRLRPEQLRARHSAAAPGPTEGVGVPSAAMQAGGGGTMGA